MDEVPVTSRRAGSVGEALALAIEAARERLGAPMASVAVVASSRPNAELARRALGTQTSFMRVRFVTTDEVVATLARAALVRAGLTPQPAGWMAATLTACVPELADELGELAEVLARPGWRGALARAVATLEEARLGPEDWRNLEVTRYQRERLDVLEVILGAIEARRRQEQVASPARVADAALAQAERVNHPLGDVSALIFLGEKQLSDPAHEVLEAWARGRDLSRIAAWPIEGMEPPSRSTRTLGQGAHVVEVDPGPGALGRLKRGLFRPDEVEGGEDESCVEFASTPDEVREVREATRRVVRGIREGLALDRIAVAVPQTDHVDLLMMMLERAGVPTTALTGPPLGRAPSARFLRLATDIARGGGRRPGRLVAARQPAGDDERAPAALARAARARRSRRPGAPDRASTRRAGARHRGPRDPGCGATPRRSALARSSHHRAHRDLRGVARALHAARVGESLA